MSTENEGTAGTPGPVRASRTGGISAASAQPAVPRPEQPPSHQPGGSATARRLRAGRRSHRRPAPGRPTGPRRLPRFACRQRPGRVPGVLRPDASWPPPPPPGTPSYGGGGGDGSGGGWGASYQPPAPKSGRGRGGVVAALLVAALVAGGLGGGLGYTLAKNNDESGSTTVSASDTGGSVKRDAGTVAGVAAEAPAQHGHHPGGGQ